MCLLEPEGVAYWPSGQGNVVPVPVTWDLQDNGATWGQLVAGFVQADVLVVDAEMCAGINVIFWLGNVCFPVATGLLLREQLGLVEVGGVAAPKGPEHEAVTRVAAAVLKVELAHGFLLFTPSLAGSHASDNRHDDGADLRCIAELIRDGIHLPGLGECSGSRAIPGR